MVFCNKCGKEVKEGTKFCPDCGNQLTGENGSKNPQQNTTIKISCPKCGSLIPNGSISCDKCGTPLNQDSYKNIVIIGYIVTIISTLIIPILGIIISIIFALYLGTREDKSVRKHGVIMVVLAIAIFVIYFVVTYLMYMNSLHQIRSYYYYY